MDTATLEQTFWNIYREIDPDRDIVPNNAEAEKQKFFKSDCKINPQLTYREFDHSEAIRKLEKIYPQLDSLPEILIAQYRYLFDSLIKWAFNFNCGGSKNDEWLTQLYGRPAKVDIEDAYRLLEVPPDDSEDCVESVDPTNYFRKKLEAFGFFDWEVRTSNMPSKIRVSSVEKTVYVDASARFSKSMLDRLCVHELETHVLRHENGRKQPYIIFQYGFPNYLETEEGLAIYSEESSGLLSANDLRKYCLRLIASNLAYSMDFRSVYHHLLDYTNAEESYAITLRVKRGLDNTAAYGGYTKDQVYLSGLFKVRRLDRKQLARLFIGKIGIGNLDDLDGLKTTETITLPSWLR